MQKSLSLRNFTLHMGRHMIIKTFKKISVGIAPAFILILILLSTSCRPIRNVPDNQFLLNKIKIKCDEKSIQEEELLSYIKQKPNRKILGITRFHLSVYNFSTRGKDRKWKNKIGSIIGEEPVIFDAFLTQRSCDQIEKMLINKGYIHALVTFDTISKRKKRMNLSYHIVTGKPITIEKVDYKFNIPEISNFILNDSANSLLKKNSLFDIDRLMEERIRLTNLLKNNGYYYFTKEDIVFYADTLDSPNKVVLTMLLNEKKDSTYAGYYSYKLNSVNFFVGFEPKMALETGPEYFTGFENIESGGNLYFFKNKLNYNPKVLRHAIAINKGQTYMQNYVNSSYKGLTSLKTFRLVNIQFSDTGHSINAEDRKLDCFILLTPLPKQSYQLEAVGTHSSGNLGLGGNIIYQNRNIFRNAEQFDMKLHGAIERQTVVIEENDAQLQEYLPFNSLEMGGEAKLYFHTFIFPYSTENFKTQHHPKTNLLLAYNFQQRPDFSRTITNATFGYFWEGKNSNNRHSVNPIEINYVKLPFISKKFRNSINNTFLENSYTDHLVVQGSYTYTLSDFKVVNTKNLIYLRSTVEAAGNILNSLAGYANLDKNEEGSYMLFKTPFAQFVKAEFDFRYYKTLWFGQKVVYRAFAGLGYPYGNLKVLPFEKRYFSGGANSIRAWPVRTLGPGSYENSPLRVPNQTGDIKLEANLEYRFKLFWVIEGALFADAGNIWDIYKEEERESGYFDPNKFYNDIAIGTGIGFRFDFSFFIFRLDWGLKVRDPAMPSGSRLIITDGKLDRSDYTFNLGIGYPF
ncbi:MAG: hypothetical protein CVU05_09770 [Bacteroidetes bacterium HGW-Bacteroidetes-21]|nr:MAG: hypothetical protein CVU05_09770 [Bacteroidetes bacterium HGW-Bacteroidetes-21]